MVLVVHILALAFHVGSPARVSRVVPAHVSTPCARMMARAAEIQFIKGIDETVVPDIKLTRSKDGLTGTATFIFQQPSFLEATAGPQEEITGMYMVDEEGEIVTTDVNAKFINGKPRVVEAVFIMQNPPTWDRVMRFLVRRARRLRAPRAAQSVANVPRHLVLTAPPTHRAAAGALRRVARPRVQQRVAWAEQPRGGARSRFELPSRRGWALGTLSWCQNRK